MCYTHCALATGLVSKPTGEVAQAGAMSTGRLRFVASAVSRVRVRSVAGAATAAGSASDSGRHRRPIGRRRSATRPALRPVAGGLVALVSRRNAVPAPRRRLVVAVRLAKR